MANTQNYNLKKLEYTEIADIPAHFNGNMDIIDNVLKVHDDALVTNLQSAKNYTDQQVNTVNQALAAHLAETVQDDDVHGIKTLFSIQQFTNLIKNGDFASWSAGDNAAPDGWGVTGGANISKSTDLPAGVMLKSRNSCQITRTHATEARVMNQSNIKVSSPNLVISCYVKGITVNGSGLRFKIQCLDIQGSHLGYIHTPYYNLTTWNKYEATVNLLPGTYMVNIYPEISLQNDTFLITEVMVCEGKLPIAFATNPFDQALKAINHQENTQSGLSNNEYRNLRLEMGKVYIGAMYKNITNGTITFAKAFRKILLVIGTIEDVSTAEDIVFSFDSLSATSFGWRVNKVYNYTTLNWLAIGVD